MQARRILSLRLTFERFADALCAVGHRKLKGFNLFVDYPVQSLDRTAGGVVHSPDIADYLIAREHFRAYDAADILVFEELDILRYG